MSPVDGRVRRGQGRDGADAFVMRVIDCTAGSASTTESRPPRPGTPLFVPETPRRELELRSSVSTPNATHLVLDVAREPPASPR